MGELRILFTGVGRRVELVQAFRQAGLVLNHKVILYGADMSGTAPALQFCDFMRNVCGMKDPGYVDELLNICIKDDIDVVIPTIDTDLLVLSQSKHKFEKEGIKVLVSDENMIKICRDKNLTSQFFIDCGLKAPMPVNDWKKYSLGYPAFIKPKDGSSSINAFKVEDEKELKMYSSQVEDYIVQPFVDGTEYTIDVFCDFSGTPVSIVPRERVQVRAGEVLKTQICMDERMIQEAKEICKVFKPCGPLTIQLIRDSKTGEDYYIEINPRFGGGSPLSMKAGARSAEVLIKLFEGKRVDYCKNVSNGAVYSRFDQSVCISEGKNNIKGIIFDLDDTLYSEKDYVKSGFVAVGRFFNNADYADELMEYFEQGKPAIDYLLEKIGKQGLKREVLDIYREHYPNIELYEGVKDTILALKKRGIRIGIITDGRSEGQRNKLQALGLYDLISGEDIIITDELGGVQFRKPCDIAFRIIQNRWQLNFSEIVYVGDNLNKDFQAPGQLGMQFAFFNNNEGLYYDEKSQNNVSNISSFTISKINEIKNTVDL